MATQTHAPGSQDAMPESSAAKGVREWLDVGSKVIIAIVSLFLGIIANNYQQRASVVTLLSQRETAESQLRTSMLQYLIEPFVARGAEAKPLEPERAAILLSLLALNFHDHIELKPLLEEVDVMLQKDNNHEQARKGLRIVARRVVDRQIAMLTMGGATDKKKENPLNQFFPPEPSKLGSEYSLYFQEAKNKKADASVMLLAIDDNDPYPTDKKDQSNLSRPALFTKGSGGACVCSRSPSNKYALGVVVTGRDPDKGTVNVSTYISREDKACNISITADPKVWRPLQYLTLSPYDFPLTDNVSVDAGQRFALTPYMDENNTPAELVHLKLIWFPEGYIAERDRPMNYDQVNRTLGMS